MRPPSINLFRMESTRQRRRSARNLRSSSHFSVPSSEWKVQTRSLQEGWYDYLNESWTRVHLLGLKIFLPPQLSNTSLKKNLFFKHLPPLIDWLWICKQMVPENRDLISILVRQNSVYLSKVFDNDSHTNKNTKLINVLHSDQLTHIADPPVFA